jgi:hemerythrin superfamily protein
LSELHQLLSLDHARLDALLETCMRGDEDWLASYEEFRRGLLRHISIEERVLFPELRKRRGTTSLEQKLHRDHAALAALLVPPPSPAEIRQIAAILTVHNELEERAGGLYDDVESLAGDKLSALIARVHAIPAVRVAPHVDSPLVRNTIEQLLREAGAT